MEEPNASNETPQQPKTRKIINLEKGGIFWSTWNFAEAALLAVLGALVIAFSGNENLKGSILPILGGFLIVSGFLRILANFLPVFAANGAEAALKAKIRSSLAYNMVVGGAFELALGIALVVAYANGTANGVADFLVRFGVDFIAIIFIVAGASFFLFAIAFIATKLYKLYMPIVEMIFGAALIGLGVYLMISFANNTDLIERIILILVGIILILAGIGKAIATIRAIQETRAEKALEKNVIEADEGKPKE